MSNNWEYKKYSVESMIRNASPTVYNRIFNFTYLKYYQSFA